MPPVVEQSVCLSPAMEKSVCKIHMVEQLEHKTSVGKQQCLGLGKTPLVDGSGGDAVVIERDERDEVKSCVLADEMDASDDESELCASVSKEVGKNQCEFSLPPLEKGGNRMCWLKKPRVTGP